MLYYLRWDGGELDQHSLAFSESKAKLLGMINEAGYPVENVKIRAFSAAPGPSFMLDFVEDMLSGNLHTLTPSGMSMEAFLKECRYLADSDMVDGEEFFRDMN